MPIYFKDIVRDHELLDRLETEQVHCCNCNIVLQETITGKRKTPRGNACSDCYYEMLSELIEEHPITTGGYRRS